MVNYFRGNQFPWEKYFSFEGLDTFQHYKHKSRFHVGKVKIFSFIK